MDNIYDLINDLNAFIDKVNDIIILRNNLPSLMQDSFYVTCSNEQKSINVSVQTSDMPGVVTLVHQEEVTLENSDENTLSTNSMVINYEGNILSLIDKLKVSIPFDKINERIKTIFNLENKLYNRDSYLKGQYPQVIISVSYKNESKIS